MDWIVTYGEDSMYHSREDDFHGKSEELKSVEIFASEFQRVKRVFTGFEPKL